MEPVKHLSSRCERSNISDLYRTKKRRDVGKHLFSFIDLIQRAQHANVHLPFFGPVLTYLYTTPVTYANGSKTAKLIASFTIGLFISVSFSIHYMPCKSCEETKKKKHS